VRVDFFWGRKSLSVAILCATASLVCGCADSGDGDGDGKISRQERAEEMRRDGYLAMTPGRWKTDIHFSDIDVPQLAAVQRKQIAAEAGEQAARYACLSKTQAAQPGADFFGGVGSEKCTYTRFDISGNKADMALKCGMGEVGRADMDLRGTVEAEAFQFETKVTVHLPMVGKSRKITMTGQMTGKYEGACRGDE
jgi:Protein of unknown function (DUF3617)